ncbi:MAG: hypothetical protein EPN55_00700 [Gammaproteobacteria bacterium]|nr:MAG: hypothetical protein EPN55_00700 [Gammaproteobacteria bacterium]
MKKLIAVLGLALVVFAGAVSADQSVRGYYRNDGTYVQPHYRSSPDRSYNNNWSVSPNVNPYTGERGARQPTYNDRPPNNSWDNGYNSNRRRW